MTTPLPFWPLLNVQEAMWLALALWGLWFSAHNLRAARGDWAHIRAQPWLNGGRDLVARGNVRRETVRTAILVCYVLIGVVLAVPPLPHRLTGTVFVVLLLGGAGLVSLNSYLDARERRALLALLLKPHRAPAAAGHTTPEGAH